MSKQNRYVNTDVELAEKLGVTPPTIATWKRDNKLTIPHDLPDGRKDVAAWKDWQRKRKEESFGKGALRDEKLKREIALLDIEIGQLRKTLVPLDEFKSEVQGTVNLCMVLIDRFIENVSAKRRDAELETELRDCFDRARKQLLEESDQAGS